MAAMEVSKWSPEEIAAMTPAIREEIQTWALRSYLARTRRATWHPPQPEPPEPRWSNGPCVYCLIDDGFTEIRKCGPVHLDKCHARYNMVQKRKARELARV
jgi:hypothetical protein